MDTPTNELLISNEPRVATKRRKPRAPRQGQRQWPYYLLAFGIPFVLMLIAMAMHDIHPFGIFTENADHPGGDNQVLNFDFWHQYFPFLQTLQAKLQQGGSLLYSWVSGLGTNFVSMTAYYIASPLNLLTLLVPAQLLREAVTVGILIKLGCAGLFFYLFAKKTFDRGPLLTLAFSSLYALCNYATGYYWNIMWLDVFCLFPLVMLGTRELFLHSKFKLYTVTIALSLIFNYYIGFMVCVFVAISFFAYSVLYWSGWKAALEKLGLFALFSALGCMLSAVMTVPAFLGLQSTQGAASGGAGALRILHGFEELFSMLLSYHDPVAIDGLPNIFCGLVCVILLFTLFWSTRIGLREKLVTLGVMVVLFLSLNLNWLDYIWHGLHYPNQVPHRFAFIVSFCLGALALHAIGKMEKMDKWDVIGTGIFSALFLFTCGVAVFGPEGGVFADNLLDGKLILAINLVLAAFYLLLLYLRQKDMVHKKAFSLLICFAIFLELLPTAFIGIETVGPTSYSGYTPHKEGFDALMEQVESLEKDENAFYRTEFIANWSCNDPALYGYNGVSLFSSTANAGVSRLMHALGLPAEAGSNRYCYAQNTPLVNSFLNLKYLINKEIKLKDENFLEKVVTNSTTTLYKNTAYLPLGFMVGSAIQNWVPDSLYCFETQNQLFGLSTGLSERLLTSLELIPSTSTTGLSLRGLNEKDDGDFFHNYTIRYDNLENNEDELNMVLDATVPATGAVYAYMTVPGAKDVQVYCNGSLQRSVTLKEATVDHCAVYLGNYNQGDRLSLSAKIDSIYINGYCNVQVACFDNSLFERGWALLADETWQLTKFSDDHLIGTVNAQTDGILYTSIPYEKGWAAYVDGQAVETVILGGAFVGVPVAAGDHNLELRYVPQGLIPGAWISAIALIALIALCFITKKHPLPCTPVSLPPLPERKPKKQEAEAAGEQSPLLTDTPAPDPADQPTPEPADPTDAPTEKPAEETGPDTSANEEI